MLEENCHHNNRDCAINTNGTNVWNSDSNGNNDSKNNRTTGIISNNNSNININSNSNSNSNGNGFSVETRLEDEVPLPDETSALTSSAANETTVAIRSPSKLRLPVTDDEFLKDVETECGLGPCAPNWMQKFASKQTFLIVFCITWVLQGMYHTYFVSVITTIEKLFQIQSKITGIIMSATEIGQIGSSLLLTYYGGQGHRPKWIAWGMVLFAASSFMCSVPHFIYGRDIINANDVLGINNKQQNVICSLDSNRFNETNFSYRNGTTSDAPLLSKNLITESCEEEANQEQRIPPSVTKIVLTIFFVSLLGVGMGQTAVYTLGIPYIDDNVASKESPLYFAITIGVRILGPALGFIVGSLCTSIYADLSLDPKIPTTDPRWVGAWWLGLVLISGFLILASMAMFSFPQRLTGSARPSPKIQKTDAKHPSLRDFPKTVKRLLKNDILMYRTASSVLHILPIAGLYTFLPKYLESQFRLPTPSANMISGVGGILVMGIGIIISGVFILRVKPNARFVAAWIAFTAILYAMGMGILMFVGCPLNEIEGLRKTDDGMGVVESACNLTCYCDKNKFAPVCGVDGKTYFSACHAGCKKYTEVDNKITNFSECECLKNWNHNASLSSSLETDSKFGNMKIGYCDVDCSNFILYIVLFSIFVFIHSTSEVGSMLLILRCVDPKDKAMALGLIQFAIGLFGNVPCPIIYGAVVDSACMVWKITCNEKGACSLYNADVFRKFYHGVTGGLLFCAFFVDIIVWYKAGSITFVEEQAPLEEELHSITGKPRSETSA